MALTALNNELNNLRDTAAKLRSDYAREAEIINANSNLSMDGKRAELNQIQPEYKTKLAELDQRETAALEKTRLSLRRQITGTAAEGEVIAFRDAHDRAHGLETAAEAKTAMARALDVGDSSLTKAILDRAISKGWDATVELYTAAHPNMETTITDLVAIQRWHDNIPNDIERLGAYRLPDVRLHQAVAPRGR